MENTNCLLFPSEKSPGRKKLGSREYTVIHVVCITICLSVLVLLSPTFVYAAPSGPPENFQVKPLRGKGTAVTATWDPPEQTNGRIRGKTIG